MQKEKTLLNPPFCCFFLNCYINACLGSRCKVTFLDNKWTLLFCNDYCHGNSDECQFPNRIPKLMVSL